MKNKQSGTALVAIILTIVVALAITGGIYYYQTQNDLLFKNQLQYLPPERTNQEAFFLEPKVELISIIAGQNVEIPLEIKFKTNAVYSHDGSFALYFNIVDDDFVQLAGGRSGDLVSDNNLIENIERGKMYEGSVIIRYVGGLPIEDTPVNVTLRVLDMRRAGMYSLPTELMTVPLVITRFGLE